MDECASLRVNPLPLDFESLKPFTKANLAMWSKQQFFPTDSNAKLELYWTLQSLRLTKSTVMLVAHTSLLHGVKNQLLYTDRSG